MRLQPRISIKVREAIQKLPLQAGYTSASVSAEPDRVIARKPEESMYISYNRRPLAAWTRPSELFRSLTCCSRQLAFTERKIGQQSDPDFPLRCCEISRSWIRWDLFERRGHVWFEAGHVAESFDIVAIHRGRLISSGAGWEDAGAEECDNETGWRSC
jgi:hypothetical protein